MKIAEVRNILKGHSDEQLRLIIAELYKAIPKAIKEDINIDMMINSPDALKGSKEKTVKNKTPDIKSLQFETEEFVANAESLCYSIPNRIVPKKERPKWRFVVKRLYKNLSKAADVEANLPLAGKSLEKLYTLLCYSCDYVIFNTYDSFESIGIEQIEFFHKTLSINFRYQNKIDFISNAIELMVKNGLNRYTLYSELMDVILEFLKTTDMRELAIKKCSEMIKEEQNTQTKEVSVWQKDYAKERRINNLTEMGFLCYSQLYEYDNAIIYFKRNYIKEDKEVALYILLGLIYKIKQKEYFLREYEIALEEGVTPRNSLEKMYNYVKDNDEFPEYYG